VLPNKYLFSPWEAPKEELDKAGIVLGQNYPNPVIDLKLSRQNALNAFKFLKKEDV
jgi:deoxyribodipyrimidine photo-lyase